MWRAALKLDGDDAGAGGGPAVRTRRRGGPTASSTFTADVDWAAPARACRPPPPRPPARPPRDPQRRSHATPTSRPWPRPATRPASTRSSRDLAPDGYAPGRGRHGGRPATPRRRGTRAAAQRRGPAPAPGRRSCSRAASPGSRSASSAATASPARASTVPWRRRAPRGCRSSRRRSSTASSPGGPPRRGTRHTGPSLLVGDGRRVVFVTGALTRQELLSLAEGFRPLTAGATASPAAGDLSAASPAPSRAAPGP